MNIKDNKSGFSVIISIIMTSFLVILSSGILFLVLRENSNTRIVYNTISTYAGAEGALEYGLLKIKHHKDGFEDTISSSDDESRLISNISSFGKKTLIEYKMDNYGTSYTGDLLSGAYEIIPLFFDSGSLIQTNSKYPYIENNTVTGTLNFNFNIISSSSFVIWNIIGNDGSGATFGITGSGISFDTTDFGVMKTDKTEVDSYSTTQAIDFTGSNVNIGDFLKKYESNYLILYNPNDSEIKYNINSIDGFSFPKIDIVTSANIGDYTQNISFSQNKSEIFDLLKYSFFNK